MTKIAMNLEKTVCNKSGGIKEKKAKKENWDEKQVKVGIWNVRSISEEGIRNLVMIMENYEINILALQETKLKGECIISCKEYTLFSSGGENRMLGA